MDIPRIAPNKQKKRIVQGSIAAGAILLLTILLSSLKPAAPTVDSPWVDSVRRGTMVREVRGPGTLVPERIRFISALASARVERVPAQPGQTVTPGTVLLELSNPDVQIQALQAEQQLTAAQAELVSIRTTLRSQKLTQEGTVATTRTDYESAKRQAMVADSLAAHNLVAVNDAALARDKAAELEIRYRVEQQRLALMTETLDSQVAVQATQVERLRAIAAFQQNRVRSLTVRAGEAGQLTELSLQLGQWVTEGTILAKVVQPGKLKAVLHIPETQAPGLAISEPAAVDTHNGVVPGHVTRIDPAALEGTVTVEIALDGALPPGARPDISVDGTITIDRLVNVLYVGRPAYGQPNSTIGMFRLVEGGRYAVRVPVEVGRSSVNTIEVLHGLQAGDQVILSDMTRYDNVDRVRVK
ncbi:MAG: RND transporter [Gemmatimonadetes bacterium 13_1_40CM_4_69_8]|nr:MAG: RND transporter [Gemmatimonadetes bacterium 13_1_40CM_4_69_8]